MGGLGKGREKVKMELKRLNMLWIASVNLIYEIGNGVGTEFSGKA